MRLLIAYTVFGRDKRYKRVLAHQIALLKATCPAEIRVDYRVYADRHIDPYRGVFEDVHPPPPGWEDPRFAALWRWRPAVEFPEEYDVVVVGEADGMPRDLWSLVARFAAGPEKYTFVKPTWIHPFVDGGGFRPEIDAAFAMVKQGLPVGVPEINAAVVECPHRVVNHFAHYAVDDWVLTKLLYPRVKTAPRLNPETTYAITITEDPDVAQTFDQIKD